MSLAITFLEYPLNIMSESSRVLAGGEKPAGNSVHGKGLRALKSGLNSETTCLHFHPFYSNDVAAVTAAGAGVPTSSTISSGVPPGQYARAPVSPWPCPLGLALAPSW